MAVISASNLSRRFGSRWAYARVDLEINDNDRVLLIGANGSGKTTLLRTLATLLPQSVGELVLFGCDAVKESHAIRNRIGLVSHQMGLYEDLSASENLRFFASVGGVDLAPTEILMRLSAVGLDNRAEPVRSYSAGMRKRLALAALKLKSPELLLLDEPFAALDPKGIDDISTLISEMPGTMVMASHQVERAASICTTAILLEAGQIIWQGPADKAWAAWRKSQEMP